VTKYYRVTAVLHEDEYEFVRQVAEAFRCSVAKAISVCVVWAKTQSPLPRVIEEIKKAETKGGREK